MGTQLLLPKKGVEPPVFSPCPLWSNGCMDQDATWCEGKPRPRPHCITWGPSLPSNRGTAPNFRPMSIVAERSPISATAEHLLHSSRQKVPIIYNGTPFAPPPQNCPLGDLDPDIIHGSCANRSPQPKRHLNRFSRSCRAH